MNINHTRSIVFLFSFPFLEKAYALLHSRLLTLQMQSRRRGIISPLAKVREARRALSAQDKALDVSFLKLPGKKLMEDEVMFRS